jgi:purine-nucleoside phosphorylase
MNTLRERLDETRAFLEKRIDSPTVALILGSGLGDLTRGLEDPKGIPYAEIPNFPTSTVKGHEGSLAVGRLAGLNALVFKGRFHYYEGFDMETVTFPVRLAKWLGAELLILSNAAGGLNPDFRPGDIMLIDDHINMLPENPLRGPNDEALGPRFPSMHDAYSKRYRELAWETAKETGIEVKRGVYLALQGPDLETTAEYRMVRVLGGDCVGMSTVPEVIVAAHMGLPVLGFSVITNCPDFEAPKPATHDEVLGVAKTASERLSGLVETILGRAKERGLLEGKRP